MTKSHIHSILILSLFFIKSLLSQTGVVGEHPSQTRKLSPDQILQLSDRSRNGWDSFIVRTRIKNFENDHLLDQGDFEVYIKGRDKTLVKFLNTDVKGQYLLMAQDEMWIYLPNTRKPIRITPLQRLMGNASNGDVTRTRYAEDYSAILNREDVLDGTLCYLLELRAKHDAATYQRISYWISKESYQPKRAEIYLTSGKHYKTILYDSYENVLNQDMLTAMTLIDRLRESRKTTIQFTSYEPKSIPEKYFHKDYLDKLR